MGTVFVDFSYAWASSYEVMNLRMGGACAKHIALDAHVAHDAHTCTIPHSNNGEVDRMDILRRQQRQQQQQRAIGTCWSFVHSTNDSFGLPVGQLEDNRQQPGPCKVEDKTHLLGRSSNGEEGRQLYPNCRT